MFIYKIAPKNLKIQTILFLILVLLQSGLEIFSLYFLFITIEFVTNETLNTVFLKEFFTQASKLFYFDQKINLVICASIVFIFRFTNIRMYKIIFFID